MKDQCSLAKSCLAFGAKQTLIACWSAALPPTLVLMAIPQWVEWHWSAGRQAGRTNTLSHWHGSVLSDLLYIITWPLTRQRGGEGQCFNSHLVRVHCVLCKHIYPGMCGVWTCLNLLHWQYAGVGGKVHQHFTAALRYHSGSSMSHKPADNILHSWGVHSRTDPLLFFLALASGFVQKSSTRNRHYWEDLSSNMNSKHICW